MSILPFIVMIPMIPVAIMVALLAARVALDTVTILTSLVKGLVGAVHSPK